VNRVEGAGPLTVAESEAAPRASLATTGHDGRGTTAFEAAVFGDLVRLQLAAGALQSCNQFFGMAGVDLEELGDVLDRVDRADRALAGLYLAGDELLGERQATPTLRKRCAIASTAPKNSPIPVMIAGAVSTLVIS
jgi:hypothetical protein